MTDKRDHKANVSELQVYLRSLSFVYPQIPRIAIDGIYGRETTEAVKQFQKLSNIASTGETDFATWTAIFNLYVSHRRASNALPMHIFPEDKTEIKEDSDIKEIYTVQFMLDFLSQKFDNIRPVNIDGIYSEKTKNSVMDFQKRANVKVTGIVNIPTWNALVRTYHIS